MKWDYYKELVEISNQHGYETPDDMLMDQTHTVREFSEILQVTDCCIRTHLKSLGIEPSKKRTGYKDITKHIKAAQEHGFDGPDELILSLHDKKTKREIAMMINIHRTRLYDHYNRLGIC